MSDDTGRMTTRREALCQAGTGLGMLGLFGMLGDAGYLGSGARAADQAGNRTPVNNPLAPRPTHFPARARHLIHIYLNGGPSQVDTFDPKPLLKRYEGKVAAAGEPDHRAQDGRRPGVAIPVPEVWGERHRGQRDLRPDGPAHRRHLRDPLDARQYAQPRTIDAADELRRRAAVAPSMGSWLTYGMGTENANLPGFIAMCPGLPVADVANWKSAFLPGVFQGTYIDTRKSRVEDLIENIRNTAVTRTDQRRQLDLLSDLNRMHQASRAEDDALEARIASFELAYRMQMAATDAFDVSQEPQHVRDAYGPGVQAQQLLIARRLVERGVRFVQLYHGDVQPWDAHDHLADNHRALAGQCDQAIAALLTDLKQRGLLEETLVLCGGEFGRTPAVEMVNGKPGGGRDHNHWGFTVWLAGGGVRGGHIHGATDEFGYQAVEKPMHVHDLHATILHLLGFDHTKLTYRYAGRDFRLTDVHGDVVRDILA